MLAIIQDSKSVPAVALAPSDLNINPLMQMTTFEDYLVHISLPESHMGLIEIGAFCHLFLLSALHSFLFEVSPLLSYFVVCAAKGIGGNINLVH